MRGFDKIKSLFSSNKASIGKESNGNLIIQDSSIDNLFVCNGTTDIIRTMGKLQQYDDIQKVINECMSAAKEIHPLRPYFTVKYNNELERLVSTPETADAFKQYPKTIKGTFRLNYEKYPYMDKAETPWEYAYRTQSKVELKTTAYQEYLGDRENPFPTVKYEDGMITRIEAPSFPPAVNAIILSGDISIPICIRRKPCMEYGQMIIGTVSNENGLDITLTIHKDSNDVDFKITKKAECELSIQLQREKLLDSIRNTKQFCIMINDSPLVKAEFKDGELLADMFVSAPRMVEYLENLQTIETYTGCKFTLSKGEVYLSDYRTSYILASSLKGMWHRIKMDFDDEVRCDYNNISSNIENDAALETDKIIEVKVIDIFLQGQKFSVDKYIIVYRGAKINNIKSVVKNCAKKKKNILMTFRPVKGKDFFYKYCKLEGIKVISEQ